MFPIAGRGGLRWKFNVVVLPAIAISVAVLGMLDAAHERQAVFAAHVMHASGARTPLEPTPESVARQTLVIHGVYAIVLLALIALILNTALSRFVLGPIGLIRGDIEKMERGHWRLPAHLADGDEVGYLVASVQTLGVTLDALVAHMIRAERLATLAAMAATTSARIEPCTERIGAAVSRLYERQDGASRTAARQISSANVEIVRAVRGLNRVFESSCSSIAVRGTRARSSRLTDADGAARGVA